MGTVEPHIFIEDAPPEVAANYLIADKHDWNREDWIGHFCGERVTINNRSYSAEVESGEYDVLLKVTLFVKDSEYPDRLPTEFDEGNELEVFFEDGKRRLATVVCKFDKEKETKFNKVLLEIRKS